MLLHLIYLSGISIFLHFSVYPFQRHIFFPFLWHLVCRSISGPLPLHKFKKWKEIRKKNLQNNELDHWYAHCALFNASFYRIYNFIEFINICMRQYPHRFVASSPMITVGTWRNMKWERSKKKLWPSKFHKPYIITISCEDIYSKSKIATNFNNLKGKCFSYKPAGHRT